MSAAVSLEQVVSHVLGVLDESIDPRDGRWSYFTDPGPDAGLLGSVRDLSAAEASVVVGGTSIAQHLHHVIFSMNASASWIRGERVSHDWEKSWGPPVVDDATWADLLQRVRDGHQPLRAAVMELAEADDEAIGAAVGAVAHLAYHLGAIRQKRAVVRAGGGP